MSQRLGVVLRMRARGLLCPYLVLDCVSACMCVGTVIVRIVHVIVIVRYVLMVVSYTCLCVNTCSVLPVMVISPSGCVL